MSEDSQQQTEDLINHTKGGGSRNTNLAADVVELEAEVVVGLASVIVGVCGESMDFSVSVVVAKI